MQEAVWRLQGLQEGQVQASTERHSLRWRQYLLRRRLRLPGWPEAVRARVHRDECVLHEWRRGVPAPSRLHQRQVRELPGQFLCEPKRLLHRDMRL
jgi:hypothetical protein